MLLNPILGRSCSVVLNLNPVCYQSLILLVLTVNELPILIYRLYILNELKCSAQDLTLNFVVIEMQKSNCSHVSDSFTQSASQLNPDSVGSFLSGKFSFLKLCLREASEPHIISVLERWRGTRNESSGSALAAYPVQGQSRLCEPPTPQGAEFHFVSLSMWSVKVKTKIKRLFSKLCLLFASACFIVKSQFNLSCGIRLQSLESFLKTTKNNNRKKSNQKTCLLKCEIKVQYFEAKPGLPL